VRVLSNNALLALCSDGTRKVLLGRGIAFGRRLGDRLDPCLASEAFVPDGTYPIAQLAAFVSETPIEVIAVARRVVGLAEERAAVKGSQALLLGLADHLHFAAERARQGIAVEYPLRWEVAQLYPQEVVVGRAAVELASAELGVPIPADEATAVAMHLVNAQFASADLSATAAMTERLTMLVDVVTAAMGIRPAEDSVTVARFVTHLRYLFARRASGAQITQTPPGLESGRRTPRRTPSLGACGRSWRWTARP
jgi:beta-glucoside operon transcriptional antiterminator